MAITKATASSVAPAAKGDLVVGSATNDAAVLGVGSADQVLTVDSSTTTGLKWATASAGGMTLISTTTLTGASVTLSSIPQTYNNLRLVIRNYRPASDQTLYATFNNVTSGYRVIESTSYYASADTGSGDTYLKLLYDQNTDNSTNSNIIIVDIDDYANTATFKLGRSQFYKEGANGTDYNQGFFPFASYSTSAVSSIELLNTGAANFTSGTVLLYGVK